MFLKLSIIDPKTPLRLYDLSLPAEAEDSLLSLRRELVRSNGEWLRELPLREHLEPRPNLVDHTPLHEQFRGHDRSGLEDLQPLEIDLGELFPEGVPKAPLRKPSMEGHLPSFE